MPKCITNNTTRENLIRSCSDENPLIAIPAESLLGHCIPPESVSEGEAGIGR